MFIQLSGKTKVDDHRMKNYVKNKKTVNLFVICTGDFKKGLGGKELTFQHDII